MNKSFEVFYLESNEPDGKWQRLGEIKDIEVAAEEVESESEKIISLAKLAKEGLTMTVHIEEESPFLREIQNQAKKYKRDKAAYKFWKDQEFVANNRAGRRRRK